MQRMMLRRTAVGEDITSLKFTIDLSKAAGTTFTIPTLNVNDYNVDWGDGTTSTGFTGDATHDYGVSTGIFQITVSGNTFNQFYFNNGGDKLKIISVDQWGAFTYSITQNLAFWGCTNLVSIAEDIEWMNSTTQATRMFNGCKLTSLPSVLTLASLELGASMFLNNLFTTLPSGMLLSSLTTGTGMFGFVPLTSLPSSMTLSNLSLGATMFRNTLLASLPSGMLLSSLTTGQFMFFNCSLLTSLPSGMTLSNPTNTNSMFVNCIALSAVPSGMTLTNMNNGAVMFGGVTLSTASYSQLLVNIEANNVNNGITFSGGNSKYNAAGQTARNILTSAPRNWIIIDGGLE